MSGRTGDLAGGEEEREGDAVDRALAAFRDGQPVLVHDFDDREGETDIVYPAGAVTADAVARLRNDAGGLVCTALSHDAATAMDLPFLDDTIDHPSAGSHELGYDDRSSFSLPVNHRDTFTGIPDDDRALTITELASAAESAVDGDYDAEDFAADFRSPGHVNVLRAAPGLLADRQGHTELGLALAAEAGLPPAVVVCEMLDDETGRALSKAAARDYATRHGFVFVDGDQLVDRLR
jgi:3,4-dihydroxy 2-butanone 4-phosphate synthase